MLFIAFLWHMHQPYYRNPLSGEYALPWVRLHAFKGYYDMISLLQDYPEIRQTFNLVPSLLCQVNEYSRGETKDIFLEHSRKPASELNPEERKFLLANFFMCSWETMVKPYPGYWALLKKRGVKVPEYRLGELIDRFRAQEFRDLQVWFNLTWSGYRARRENPFLKELLKKGQGFTEAEKISVLEIQQEIVRKLIPLYRDMRSAGQVELTTSPFYHPILPLLMNWNLASRALPKAALPGSFSHPEDAEAQIQNAVSFHADTFGARPIGMWPSEGSVCPEMIPLLTKAGIQWMATDEGILFKSLPRDSNRGDLYRPYRTGFQGSEVSIVFRDRNLSDLIGFTYSRNPARSSVDDFISHLKNIQQTLPGNEDHLVVIALDGENAWEYYPDGGLQFLSGIYERLSREPLMRTVTIGEYLEKSPPREVLPWLHSGSWIDQNFRIWIGSPEDNLAWNFLKRTRNFLQKATSGDTSLSPEKKKMAWEEIYIAEGSDWFWWFGDDFTSDNDEEFDRLFRMHLSNIHLLLGTEVPEYLKNPVASSHEVKPTLEPLGLISPILDGRVSHFYEWREAGYFAAKISGGSMYRGEGFISGFFYGFDLERLYFRIDPIWRKSDQLGGLELDIHITEPREWHLTFPLKFSPQDRRSFSLYAKNEGRPARKKDSPHIGADSIIELAVSFVDLQFLPREKVHFFVQVLRGELEVERYPRTGYLTLAIPDRDFESDHWQI